MVGAASRKRRTYGRCRTARSRAAASRILSARNLTSQRTDNGRTLRTLLDCCGICDHRRLDRGSLPRRLALIISNPHDKGSSVPPDEPLLRTAARRDVWPPRLMCNSSWALRDGLPSLVLTKPLLVSARWLATAEPLLAPAHEWHRRPGPISRTLTLPRWLVRYTARHPTSL